MNVQRLFFLILILNGVPLFGGSVNARQWVSHDGRFKVQADLIRFDGLRVDLKTGDGLIAVPVDRLSRSDREYLWTRLDDPRVSADVPQPLKDFRESMELMRPTEIRRIEKRLELLRKELRSGSRETNHPVGRQARSLIKHLGKRLALLKSEAPFTPTLSPKDFRVGQIGTFDDDLQFSVRSDPEGDERKISISFFEHRHINRIAGARNNWHTTTISRPDLIILKADFVSQIPTTRLDRDPKSPANRMLRSRVYQIVEMRPRGIAKDYVLAPFTMDDIDPLLKGEPRKTDEAIAIGDDARHSGLPGRDAN